MSDQNKLGLLNIKRVKLSDMKPADYNPRFISDNAKAGLMKSLEIFGLVDPIVVNSRTGNIVGGHQRYSVLLEKGVQETDAVVVDLDDAQEKSLNITLNNSRIQGDFSDEKLIPLLDELKVLDLKVFEDLELKFLELPVFEPIQKIGDDSHHNAMADQYLSKKIILKNIKSDRLDDIKSKLIILVAENFPEDKIEIE